MTVLIGWNFARMDRESSSIAFVQPSAPNANPDRDLHIYRWLR